MKRLFVISLNIIICMLLCSSIAMALTCVETKLPEDFERSEAVFVGKVIKSGGWINPYVDFKVEKSWKSVDTDEFTVYINSFYGENNFIEGETYLIYTYNMDGFSYTGDCSRTRKLSDAKEDLIYLENKPTISLAPKFFTRNMKTGLITGVIVFVFLGLGYVLMRFKGK